ncbi:MAG: hypothetical protein ACOX83_04815 [Candidatus Spyradocola sp.]|jgi:hypothetical protein
MFVRNVETQWGETPRLTVLDKLVFPFALPEWDREYQLAQLLGDDCPGGEQEENFYRNEDFRKD